MALLIRGQPQLRVALVVVDRQDLAMPHIEQELPETLLPQHQVKVIAVEMVLFIPVLLVAVVVQVHQDQTVGHLVVLVELVALELLQAFPVAQSPMPEEGAAQEILVYLPERLVRVEQVVVEVVVAQPRQQKMEQLELLIEVVVVVVVLIMLVWAAQAAPESSFCPTP
jgi:hypothetical protein